MVLGASKVAALSAPNPHRFSSKVVREDEPVLVAAAKSGDAAAFEELVNRYERKIFRLTMNITRNREDAEDAMQDAFMKAYSHLNNFQEDSRFYTWLVRIAANEALMRKILDQVIDQLDPDFRTVFVLRDIEELSTEETAAALGLSVPAVKSRLLRARLKLRQKLDRYMRDRKAN
jgi:RNA polymerase sigma-70 factor (ECF subfamily)